MVAPASLHIDRLIDILAYCQTVPTKYSVRVTECDQKRGGMAPLLFARNDFALCLSPSRPFMTH